MGGRRVQVNLANVESMRSATLNYSESIDNLNQSLDCISVACEKIQEQLVLFKEQSTESSNVLQQLIAKIENLKNKKESLEAELAITPPTISVSTGDTDENGNAVVEEEANPAYEALEREIAALEVKIIDGMAIKANLDESIDQINRTMVAFEDALLLFKTVQTGYETSCKSSLIHCTVASNVLVNISTVINDYMAEKIGEGSMPISESSIPNSSSEANSLVKPKRPNIIQRIGACLLIPLVMLGFLVSGPANVIRSQHMNPDPMVQVDSSTIVGRRLTQSDRDLINQRFQDPLFKKDLADSLEKEGKIDLANRVNDGCTIEPLGDGLYGVYDKKELIILLLDEFLNGSDETLGFGLIDGIEEIAERLSRRRDSNPLG